MTAYSDLMTFSKQTSAISQTLGRLSWDMECVMPKGSVNQRSEEIAALEGVVHERRADPRVGEWLSNAHANSTTEAAQLREIKRAYERATKVPADLASEIARVTALAHGTWAEARAHNSFAAFAPALKMIVDLKRQEASALTGTGALYDALLDEYEPGATGESVAAIFDAMRKRLVVLREKILAKDPAKNVFTGTYDETAQLKLSQKLADAFCYNMARGRIDKAVHPFSSGSGQDVRITTRTSAEDPLNCFYSTVHEVGHAVYEQNVSDDLLLTPLGRGVSLGVHESQSRIFENQLARSRAFCAWLHPQMEHTFGRSLGSTEQFYAAVNRVFPGYIRTEADEVHYNLHIMLRFDLERDLISGALEVADLEDAWNARFEADFGQKVDVPSNGCLQDVHWSAGLFGYFPTYSLGNVYAGCLHKTLRDERPELDTELAKGDPSTAVNWLIEKVHQYGAIYEPRTLIERATGAAPSEHALLDYLEEKYSDIYNL